MQQNPAQKYLALSNNKEPLQSTHGVFLTRIIFGHFFYGRISPSNLPTLRPVAARTLNQILLAVAALTKQWCASRVMYTTGTPLFCQALHEQPLGVVSYYGECGER
jgi:hypothetical protein